MGLGLARSIVADRNAHGPFGSLEGLDRVPGIGAGLLSAIGGQASFSSAGRPGSAPQLAPVAATTSSQLAQPSLPGVESTVHLNRATAAELERLPHIGPYMARQIVAFRERHGPFAAVDSLLRVPGIGPATLAKVRGRVTVE